jgi:hypothetical protein
MTSIEKLRGLCEETITQQNYPIRLGETPEDAHRRAGRVEFAQKVLDALPKVDWVTDAKSGRAYPSDSLPYQE